jgi:hypothetical protein
MEYTTDFLQQLLPMIEKQVRAILEGQEATSITEIEQKVQGAVREIGSFWVSAWLEQLEGVTVPAEVSCSCGGKARYVRRRRGVVLTVMGRVRFRRAYYLCARCHCGQYPLDQRLGYVAGCLTPRLRSLAGQVGAALPFSRGQVLLESLSGVSLSENTIRQATQQVGAAVCAVEKEWQEESEKEEVLWQHEHLPTAAKPARLYGSLDGVMAPVGKEWRELKVGCWYEEVRPCTRPEQGEPERRARQISYYADFQEAKDFGVLLWSSGCQRLAEQAGELIFVADGAAWIWNLVAEHFPKAVQIVDWYHATEYIAALAQAAFGEGTPENREWQARVRSDLWEGRFEQVLAAFEQWVGHRQAGEAARQALSYYRNNRARMRYAEFRSKEYRIGSGTVESGCKQIGTQRLKVAGARWGKEGGRKTAKARAALLSGQWDAVAAHPYPLPMAA